MQICASCIIVRGHTATTPYTYNIYTISPLENQGNSKNFYILPKGETGNLGDYTTYLWKHVKSPSHSHKICR